jgi:hypothetical protein
MTDDRDRADRIELSTSMGFRSASSQLIFGGRRHAFKEELAGGTAVLS